MRSFYALLYPRVIIALVSPTRYPDFVLRRMTSEGCDRGLRGPDDDIGQPVKGPDMQGIHDNAAWRENLLIQHDIQTSKRKDLIRSAGGDHRHSTDCEPSKIRHTGAGSSQD